MSTQLSPLESLKPEVLIHIALYAGTSSPLGPPTDLQALVCTSRTLYDALAFPRNKHLWANIFRFKFDTKAAARRLSERWRTAGCLAAEGRKRFTAMKRIRQGVVAGQHHLSDLWTAYLMFLESDGKNESQLLEWSDIRRYLYHVIFFKANAPQGSAFSWFSDTEGTALTVWLLWMTASTESIRTEHPQLRAEIRALLHPFLVAGCRYPSFQAPDSHFCYPLCPEQDTTALDTSGPLPKTATLIHYNHRLTIAAPSLTSAALLATVVRVEAVQDISPLPVQAMTLPPTREVANALGIQGKTLADVQEFHYAVRTRLLERCTLDQDAGGSESSPVIHSGRHDEAWYRLVSCYDLWNDQTALRGKMYTVGTMSGSWDGRVLIPHTQHYWGMLLNPQTRASTVGVSHDRISLEIEEHHCLYPDRPLMLGTDETGCGDDILNAWLPRDIDIKHVDSAIEIHDPVTGQNVRYETIYPNKPSVYSKEVCDRIQTPWLSGEDSEDEVEEDLDGGAVLAEQVTSIDDEDRVDSVDHLSSGVRDILITGKTSRQQGEAWGHFTIIGRVRPWDGLCVFVRTPTNADEAQLGRWIFKGYIHDDRLVGRWRETSTSVEHVGWEGGFAMCKIRQ